MKKVFIILIFLASFPALSQVYVLGDVGYFNLRQKKALENDVTPKGTSFNAGVGFREKFYEVEASYFKTSAEDDVIHDSVKNKMVHKQSSILFALNFYLTDRFYARVGYGFNRIDQKLKKPVSDASDAGADKAYGLVKDKVSDGPLFGAGFVLLDGRHGTVFTQFEYMNFSSVNSGGWNASLGFRFYFGK